MKTLLVILAWIERMVAAIGDGRGPVALVREIEKRESSDAGN